MAWQTEKLESMLANANSIDDSMRRLERWMQEPHSGDEHAKIEQHMERAASELQLALQKLRG